MKKKILSLIIMMLICIGMAIPANAQGFTDTAEITLDTNTVISTFADKIEVKYRLYNGKRQYRRWNVTRGYWVDPYWINL